MLPHIRIHYILFFRNFQLQFVLCYIADFTVLLKIYNITNKIGLLSQYHSFNIADRGARFFVVCHSSDHSVACVQHRCMFFAAEKLPDGDHRQREHIVNEVHRYLTRLDYLFIFLFPDHVRFGNVKIFEIGRAHV